MTWHDHYTKMLAAVNADIDGANADGEEVDSADLEMKTFLEQRLQKTDSIDKAEAGANGMDYGKEHNTTGVLPFSHYKWVRLNYQSLDKDKNPITLSTLLAYPERWFVTETPQNLVIGCHITITQDKQRPSYYETIGSDVGLLVMHASSEKNDVCYNNLVVMRLRGLRRNGRPCTPLPLSRGDGTPGGRRCKSRCGVVREEQDEDGRRMGHDVRRLFAGRIRFNGCSPLHRAE